MATNTHTIRVYFPPPPDPLYALERRRECLEAIKARTMETYDAQIREIDEQIKALKAQGTQEAKSESVL